MVLLVLSGHKEPCETNRTLPLWLANRFVVSLTQLQSSFFGHARKCYCFFSNGIENSYCWYLFPHCFDETLQHPRATTPRPWDLSWLETPPTWLSRELMLLVLIVGKILHYLDKGWMIANSLQIHDLKTAMNLHPSNTSSLIVWFGGWCWNGRIPIMKSL